MANSYSSSGTTLTVYPPLTASISYSNFYELIIMPIGIDPTRCTAVGCSSQSGFLQAGFD
jgi:hypothetical protein